MFKKTAQERRIEISKKLGEILKEHGGLESNVPADPKHEYWILKNELQKLSNGIT